MTDSIAAQNPHIYSYLKEHPVAVLATSSLGGLPHAAVVYLSVDENLKIYFASKETTNKVQNLKENPKAAIVVYDALTQTTAQIKGVCTRVQDQQQAAQVLAEIAAAAKKTAHTTGLPMDKLDGGARQVYCIVPETIRVAEYKYESGQNLFEVFSKPDEQLGG